MRRFLLGATFHELSSSFDLYYYFISKLTEEKKSLKTLIIALAITQMQILSQIFSEEKFVPRFPENLPAGDGASDERREVSS